ncbi:ABC transporter substrate-binding protein [Haloprofundus marisrubri]|uniref:ABC transporter substrate-binding protein n=1 Tax=Haloprofundus marisrubri TaxID=1514971 RepID=A0A0W1R3S2_9EURY|nr:ABC transporter substrate-binding protein [Haloprofundus marisrubri]KTG07774.1 ABC transporter substrate-binding protein [Haloprofundus marisrubri]
MERGSAGRKTSTRRAYLKYGSTVVGAGLLAGCAGDEGEPEPAGTTVSEGSNDTEATSTTDDETESTTESSESGSYSVSMAPVGTVEFESVPQNVMVYSLLYADMAVAYGHGDSVNSLGFDADAGGNTLDAYYERLDGVSFDRSGLEQLNTGSGDVNVSKELFYELNSDLHLVDPALVASFDGWEQSDIDEVRENIAPWFGNNFSRSHSQPPEAYRDAYEYYTLWEISGRVSRAFQQQQRFEALQSVHDDLLERIQSNLPPEEERPSVGVAIFMQETFYPSKLNGPGFAAAHTRPMGANDAFMADDVTYETSYDYETMLEIDPDIILHPYGIASYYDVGQIRQTLENHPVGSQMTAVQNGRVYPSGTPTQGPLMNLFQLEMTAKQLYPEQFGEWPDYESGSPYPEIPAEEQLFDRQRVADIVAGEF